VVILYNLSALRAIENTTGMEGMEKSFEWPEWLESKKLKD